MDANHLSLLAALMTIITSGTATSYLTQFLKLPVISIPAERFPRTTALILSVLTSVATLLIQGVAFNADPITVAGILLGTFFLSSGLYKVAIEDLPSNKAIKATVAGDQYER